MSKEEVEEESKKWVSLGCEREAEPTKLIGVCQKPYSSSWTAYITINEEKVYLGDYESLQAASFSHDIEAMRIFGLESGPHLNSLYEVCECNFDKESKKLKRFLVKTKQDLEFTVDYIVNENESGNSELKTSEDKAQIVNESYEYFNRGINALPLVFGTVPVPRNDYGRKWSERISNSHSFSSAFTFDVQMNHLSNELTGMLPSINFEGVSTLVKKVHEALGLYLDTCVVPYSAISRGGRYAHCAGVVDAGVLFPVVQPGDMLLSVGDSSLVFGLPGIADPISLVTDSDYIDKICAAILAATGLITLKFLRRSGVSPNSIISPSELSLLLRDVSPSARFSTVPNSAATEIAGPLKLYLQNADSNAPSVVKKMLSGQAIQWDTNSNPSAAGVQPANASPTVTTSGTGTTIALLPDSLSPHISKYTAQAKATNDKLPGKMGIYRDKQKWMSIVSLPSAVPVSTSVDSSSQSASSSGSGIQTLPTGVDGTKLFLVGKYETEEEATVALKKARKEIAVTGTFVYKRPVSNISSFVQNFTLNNLANPPPAASAATAAAAATTTAPSSSTTTAVPLMAPSIKLTANSITVSTSQLSAAAGSSQSTSSAPTLNLTMALPSPAKMLSQSINIPKKI